MKKRTRKLALSRETLRLLGPEVNRAVGAGTLSCTACYTCDFMVCVTTTNTNSDACPSFSCLKNCTTTITD